MHGTDLIHGYNTGKSSERSSCYDSERKSKKKLHEITIRSFKEMAHIPPLLPLANCNK